MHTNMYCYRFLCIHHHYNKVFYHKDSYFWNWNFHIKFHKHPLKFNLFENLKLEKKSIFTGRQWQTKPLPLKSSQVEPRRHGFTEHPKADFWSADKSEIWVLQFSPIKFLLHRQTSFTPGTGLSILIPPFKHCNVSDSKKNF